MLNENAEAKIKEWVTVTLNNIKYFMGEHQKSFDPEYSLLNLAIHEDESLSCYWNVYHSTFAMGNFDDDLWKDIQETRKTLNSLRPEF